MRETIKITYLSDRIEKLRYIDGKSDWIDLRSAEDITLKKGEFHLINLGVSMCLPDGYEMLIAPRSSTFKNFGIIQTNSVGVVDEAYGKTSSKDVLMMPVYAVRDTEVHVNDRVCQFRIIRHQPVIDFVEVTPDNEGEARGGFGSTGVK
ncbi:MAG: deoxyuridine 5'-triphosphate nucleotidohydrolase [Lachnospiraceae bacterium]|nr:deoxyuridine 5'-triphosphate nucleotidohydrolase [Lachnospiraceae bacterium]